MRKIKKPKKKKTNTIKISDSDRAEVWKYIKKIERDIREETVKEVQLIMMTAFVEYQSKKYDKMSYDEMESLTDYIFRTCKFYEEGLVVPDDLKEIFNKHSEAQLSIEKK